MKISVKAKTRARENKIEQKDGYYVVSVKDIPESGKANGMIIKMLAKHFKTPIASVSLIKGHTSKQKVFEIEE